MCLGIYHRDTIYIIVTVASLSSDFENFIVTVASLYSEPGIPLALRWLVPRTLFQSFSIALLTARAGAQQLRTRLIHEADSVAMAGVVKRRSRVACVALIAMVLISVTRAVEISSEAIGQAQLIAATDALNVKHHEIGSERARMPKIQTQIDDLLKKTLVSWEPPLRPLKGATVKNHRFLSDSANATECLDFDDDASAATGYDCATLAAYGQCGIHLCPTCDAAGVCDASCGYCSAAPTTSPTLSADCLDFDDEASAATGYDCATLAAYGQCDIHLCPTCDAAGVCDASCGYCSSECLDFDDDASAATGYDCATLAAYGQCDIHLCPTCDAAGVCDASCGYCSSASADAPSVSPTISQSPTTQSPTPTPTPVPSTSNPTATASPTSTHAPTRTGVYDISTFDELSDEIAAAEDGRLWDLTLTADVNVSDSIIVWPNKQIKVVGSYALGRRVRVKAGAANPAGFLRIGMWENSHGGMNSQGSVAWLENLDVSGFFEIPTAISEEGGEVSDSSSWAVKVGGSSLVTVFNCRFFKNHGASLWIVGWNTTAFVRNSEFTDNTGKHGPAIDSGQPGVTNIPTFIEVTDTVFARNSATQAGGAIGGFPGMQLAVRNCSFYDNYSPMDGAAIRSMRDDESVGKATTLKIDDSLFWNNTADGKAGAIYVGGGLDCQITNTKFTDNAAASAGALYISETAIVAIAACPFERNKALVGEGGAILAEAATVYLVDSDFSENSALTNGGAVRQVTGILMPRGATHFVRNTAKRSGGAVSLDASSLKTNEGALVFAENEARLGGALSAENDASVLISAGCQTITFEMKFAESGVSGYAESTSSMILRRMSNATGNAALNPRDMIDARGDWTILLPPGSEDTSMSLCLEAGVYEVVGAEGALCVEGWNGGSIRAANLAEAELFTFEVGVADGCMKTSYFTVADEDTAISKQSVVFEGNRATGTLQGVCGAGCGGALFLGESCSADLDRVDFSRNAAADGGALFVDLLCDLSVSRAKMRDNTATANGGALNVAMLSKISLREIMAKHNVAGNSGGMMHLVGLKAATLRDVDASGNHAGTVGGAVAIFDTMQSVVTLANSTIRQNKASDSGGGIFLQDSFMELIGVSHLDNLAEAGNGGAVATSGANALLELSDTECFNVDVLIDWRATGAGCPAIFNGFSCEALIYGFTTSCDMMEVLFPVFAGTNPCSGCTCNIV